MPRNECLDHKQAIPTGTLGLTSWYVHVSSPLTNWAHVGLMETCTLDIMMHLPRSVFSEQQVDLLTWLLCSNGVPNVPSAKFMKNFNSILQESSSIRTIGYTSASVNRFYVNSLCDIIAQVCIHFHIHS